MQSSSRSRAAGSETPTRDRLVHPSLHHVDHRPWPLPDRRWSWRQTWRDLLFAHWPVPASRLRPLVPPALTLQEHDGAAWLGIVPFRMTGVSLRPLPDLPWLSSFPELNVRTYVEYGGKAGVWFLSLDAANPVAVWAARRFFHLPYFHAEMTVEDRDGRVRYSSVRRREPAGLGFRASYGSTSEPYRSAEGSLEHWLTERYCLYARAPDGRLLRTEVHHRPWPLQRAEATIERNDLLDPYGLAVEGPPSLLHLSRRLDVVVWSPEEVVG